MKTKLNNSRDEVEIFNNKNYNLLNVDKQKCINNSKTIIIILLLIIFILCLIIEYLK